MRDWLLEEDVPDPPRLPRPPPLSDHPMPESLMGSIRESSLPGPIPRHEIPGWRDRFGVVAGITGRGSETEPFDLGLNTGEPVGAVMGRWRALRNAEPGFEAHVLGNQVHQTRVLWHEQPRTGWTLIDGIDGHATQAAGLMLYVTVADCVPIYLVDPRARAVALLHAGWRGVAGKILERGVEVLSHNSKSSVADIIMHCGISICAKCYEVGSEVIEAFGLHPDSQGKAQADLPALLAGQARAVGIRQISSSSLCSAHDRDRFFSHRASRGTDGRMVAYLGLVR